MTQHAEFLPRYKHLRQVALQLNNRLVKTLSKSILDEGGKALGILKGNVLTLDTEDEIAVLMDYCIYDVRRQGVNAVERFLAESPPPADSDEMVLLQAMRQARYSLVAVEGSERGVGVDVRDLLRDAALFLMDVGFSGTARRGMVLAARIVAPEGMNLTTGAALPLGTLSEAKRADLLQVLRNEFPGMDFRNPSPDDASRFAARVIRTCLASGAAEHIEYLDPKPMSGPRRWSSAAPAPRRVGRNDRCPCGSGKKFKHCCGASR